MLQVLLESSITHTPPYVYISAMFFIKTKCMSGPLPTPASISKVYDFNAKKKTPCQNRHSQLPDNPISLEFTSSVFIQNRQNAHEWLQIRSPDTEKQPKYIQ